MYPEHCIPTDRTNMYSISLVICCFAPTADLFVCYLYQVSYGKCKHFAFCKCWVSLPSYLFYCIRSVGSHLTTFDNQSTKVDLIADKLKLSNIKTVMHQYKGYISSSTQGGLFINCGVNKAN